MASQRVLTTVLFTDIVGSTERDRLGGIYAGAKRPAEAQQAYMYALLAWRGADPEIEPRIADADRALARLASEE